MTSSNGIRRRLPRLGPQALLPIALRLVNLSKDPQYAAGDKFIFPFSGYEAPKKEDAEYDANGKIVDTRPRLPDVLPHDYTMATTHDVYVSFLNNMQSKERSALSKESKVVHLRDENEIRHFQLEITKEDMSRLESYISEMRSSGAWERHMQNTPGKHSPAKT